MQLQICPTPKLFRIIFIVNCVTFFLDCGSSMNTKETRQCPGKGGKRCSQFMTTLENDPHVLCRSCRGNPCARNATCVSCVSWDDAQWRRYETFYSRRRSSHTETSRVAELETSLESMKADLARSGADNKEKFLGIQNLLMSILQRLPGEVPAPDPVPQTTTCSESLQCAQVGPPAPGTPVRDETDIVYVELPSSQLDSIFDTQGDLAFPLDPNLPDVLFDNQTEIPDREVSFEGRESSLSSHHLDITGQSVRVSYPGRGLKHPPPLQRSFQEQPPESRSSPVISAHSTPASSRQVSTETSQAGPSDTQPPSEAMRSPRQRREALDGEQATTKQPPPTKPPPCETATKQRDRSGLVTSQPRGPQPAGSHQAADAAKREVKVEIQQAPTGGSKPATSLPRNLSHHPERTVGAVQRQSRSSKGTSGDPTRRSRSPVRRTADRERDQRSPRDQAKRDRSSRSPVRHPADRDRSLTSPRDQTKRDRSSRSPVRRSTDRDRGHRSPRDLAKKDRSSSRERQRSRSDRDRPKESPKVVQKRSSRSPGRRDEDRQPRGTGHRGSRDRGRSPTRDGRRSADQDQRVRSRSPRDRSARDPAPKDVRPRNLAVTTTPRNDHPLERPPAPNDHLLLTTTPSNDRGRNDHRGSPERSHTGTHREGSRYGSEQSQAGDSYLHGDRSHEDRRSTTQSQAANPLDAGEDLSTQDDTTYREVLEQIAARYPSHFPAVPPKERTGSFAERQFARPDDRERIRLPWSESFTDLQNRAQRTLDPDGTALPGVKAGKFFPVPGTLRLYRTGSVDPDLEAYKLNPAIQSLKSGQTKPSFDNVEDLVKSAEVAIRRHRVIANTMDWHLSLAVSQADELAHQADPRDKEMIAQLNRSLLSLAKSVSQLQKESTTSLANVKLRRRDAILKSLGQLSERTKNELRSKELFGPQLFGEETLQAAVERTVQDAQFKSALKTAVLVEKLSKSGDKKSHSSADRSKPSSYSSQKRTTSSSTYQPRPKTTHAPKSATTSTSSRNSGKASHSGGGRGAHRR